MNELLGWYGYNDHSAERFNNLAKRRMSTPNITTMLSQSTPYPSTNHSSTSTTGKLELSLDEIDNTTDSSSAIDDLTKLSPQMAKECTGMTSASSEKSPPASQTG